MEFDVYARFLFALVLVLALIAALAWAVRRFGFAGTLAPKPGGSARLGVVEIKALDSRRRLVLVRRDGAEHLVLLGPNRDLLIEAGIPAGRGGPAPDRAPDRAPNQARDPAGGAMP